MIDSVRRRSYVEVLVFLLAVLMLLAGGRLAPLDEETPFQMTANLVERGQLTLASPPIDLVAQTFPGFLPRTAILNQPTVWGNTLPDGRSYPLYTHAQAILQIPLYLLGRLIGGLPDNLGSLLVIRWAVSLFNPIVVALTGWLLVLFGQAWGYSPRLSIALGLVYSLGAMPLAYTHTLFSDPLLALLFTLAAYSSFRARADRSGRWLWQTGLALGLALYVRERSLIVLPVFGVYLWGVGRLRTPREWLSLAIPIGVAAALLGGWNWLRFGSPLVLGYADMVAGTGFGAPLVVGLFGLLISPGKGLLLYNPIVLLGFFGLIPLMRQRRAEGVLFTAFGLISIVFYAAYNFWTGGWNWGPRYMLTLLPLLLLAAGYWVHVQPSTARRTWFVILSVLTLLLNVPALLVDHSRYLVEFGERDPANYLNRAILRIEDSPLVRQWPTTLDLLQRSAQPSTWAAARDSALAIVHAEPSGTDFAAFSTQMLKVDEFFRLNVPDFWFVHWLLLGVSPLRIGLLAAVLLGGVILSGRRVIKMLQVTD